MSASSLSERILRSPRGAALLVAALALGLAGAGAEARTQASAADSGSTVTRVRVTDRGVFVDGRALSDSAGDENDWMTARERRRRLRESIRSEIRSGIRSGFRSGIRSDSDLIRIDDNGAGIVRIWSDAHVPAGQVVDGDVVAVFGSVTVEGAVTGDVVAVLGSVHLQDGARVDGSAVSIGGRLEQAPGVTVKGETVQMGFTPFTWGLPARSVILFAIAAGWLVSMFTGWMFALLFPTGMLRVGTVVERRPAASFFLGILSVPGFLVALILLCITVIGIPIAVLLPMVYALTGYVGQLAATAVLGARLTRRTLANGFMVPLLVGTLFVAGLLAAGGLLLVGGHASQPIALFLLFSGCLLMLGLGALGTGAFLLSRFGTRPREVVWHGHAPLPAGVGSVPGHAAPPAAG